MFYESDIAYIGPKIKESGCQGCGSLQQPVLFMLSTKIENSIPLYLKMHVMPVDNCENIEKITAKSMKLDKNRKINTDGKNTDNILRIQ